MVHEEVIKVDENDGVSTLRVIVNGVNGYRTKIVEACFGEKGIDINEIPYFVAALKLLWEDLDSVARKNEKSLGKYEEYSEAVDKVSYMVRRVTKVVKINREE